MQAAWIREAIGQDAWRCFTRKDGLWTAAFRRSGRRVEVYRAAKGAAPKLTVHELADDKAVDAFLVRTWRTTVHYKCLDRDPKLEARFRPDAQGDAAEEGPAGACHALAR